MSQYFAPSALLPTGWSDAVLVSVDAHGHVEDTIPDSTPGDAEVLNGVVVPGAVNLHSHAFQRGMAGLAERGEARGGSFWSWRDVMYRFVSSLTPDDQRAIAAQLYVEMLKAGYTSVVEFHYLHLDPVGDPYDAPAAMSAAVLEAAASSGIGITHLPTLYRSGGFHGEAPNEAQRRFTMDPEALLRMIEGLLAEAGDDPQRRVGLGLHSLRAVAGSDIVEAVSAVRSLDAEAPVHIHVAEQRREIDDCVAALGARPVEWLLANCPVDGRWCAVHATHMTPDETRDLASSGAVAGLCPTTEANLGDGLFPLPDFLATGGAIGVGSDSNVTVDPAAEIRLLEYGQRLLWEQRNVASGGAERSTGAFLYRRALAGGERAAGRPVGSLERGARADLVVLDAEHPALAGRKADILLDSWIFTSAGSPIRDVMVGGRWVVREGRHDDEEAVAERYREVAERLTA